MIVLASKSPRRKEILKNMGIDFQIVNPNVDEIVEEEAAPPEYVSIISKRKATAIVEVCLQNNSKQAIIIAADTIVCINDKILGKPQDRDDALSMLKLLNDSWHNVYTGLCVAFMNNDCIEYVQDCCVTKVKFKSLTDEQIEEYLNTDEPYDKAGAYAIQGKGSQLIEKIDGDYYNVVGLPVDNLKYILDSLPIVYTDL